VAEIRGDRFKHSECHNEQQHSGGDRPQEAPCHRAAGGPRPPPAGSSEQDEENECWHAEHNQHAEYDLGVNDQHAVRGVILSFERHLALLAPHRARLWLP
jgi:hypothetical protein